MPPRPAARKRRVHFHAFMLEVHDRIEQERRDKTREPIAKVATDIAAEAHCLCFDEFQVDNIADAMILDRLFTALFDAGVVVVATSNRAPDELYKHGLHRERFLPFIELLKERLYVLELDSGRDYRLARLVGKPVYNTPLGRSGASGVGGGFRRVDRRRCGRTHEPDGQGPHPRRAARGAQRRLVRLCRSVRPAARRRRLSGDRRALRRDHRRGHPAARAEERNEARRFNILIDTLYEARTLLIASAEVAPAEIYRCRRRHLRVPAHGLAPQRNAERGLYRRAARGGDDRPFVRRYLARFWISR